MSTLKERLDQIGANFRKEAPDEALDTMKRATEALEASGQAARARGPGDDAPDFALPDQDGEEVRLADLRAQGPVVLTFFRGHW